MRPAFPGGRAGAGVILVRPGISKRSQDQEQALVQAHKTWSQQTYNWRLDLMESRQRCVDASQSFSALKDCRRSSRKARQSLRQERRAYLNQVRDEIGLPALQTKKRRKQQV